MYTINPKSCVHQEQHIIPVVYTRKKHAHTNVLVDGIGNHVTPTDMHNDCDYHTLTKQHHPMVHKLELPLASNRYVDSLCMYVALTKTYTSCNYIFNGIADSPSLIYMYVYTNSVCATCSFLKK